MSSDSCPVGSAPASLEKTGTMWPASIILNETSDVISSPYNPRKYPDNQTCNWQITASQGNRIVLEIGPIDIESCGASGKCTCDYLQVQNGFSVDPGASERICGRHQK
ncbi:hypothetical protein OS493_023751 [Desmophyllum pertusum]|uniref:CUB domain-containing protein n=1 Tax=Desmophyllum pertusum TaxID=174260 RepID=A0A9W9YM09_9CNID|nr:hypothetical protein OS493_023751 [Desmophyllum pertusum]